LNKYRAIPEKERYPLMVVIDSMSQIPSKKEFTERGDEDSSRDMTKQTEIAGFFRTLRLEMAHLKIPMVITAHGYEDFMKNPKFPPFVPKGGNAPIYASDVMIQLGKAKERDGTDIVGAKISCSSYKSRFGREGRKVKVLLWHDERGCDRYTGLPEMAVEAGIWKKVGNRIEVNGKTYYESQILKTPEKFFTDEVLQVIDRYARTQFEYGGGDEARTETSKEDL